MNLSIPSRRKPASPRASASFAMRLSLGVGFLMLVAKSLAYGLTGSAAILSDAAESVVHVVAVCFAAYSLWLSRRPADPSHPYGHEKISFFSAGFEGAMIVLAAGYILYEAIHKWLHGPQLQNLGLGTALVAGAALLNGALGSYLISQGRRHGSLVLEANGRHVLTDSYTSGGVIVGLVLVMLTGWRPFDPMLAILVAVNILWSGGNLIRRSVGGLMDEGDPRIEAAIKSILDQRIANTGVTYHGLRYRNAGNTLWVEFHLLFPRGTALEKAHRVATEIEEHLEESLSMPAKIISHLETSEDHELVHRRSHVLD